MAFLGLQGRSQVVNLLHGCEVFVLPSRSEPFGIVILEAMACKKPVVATTAGGIPEIIENGREWNSGTHRTTTKALADALLTVLKDVNLRSESLRKTALALCTSTISNGRYRRRIRRLFHSLLQPKEKEVLAGA